MTPEQRDASQVLYELELQHNLIEQELLSVQMQDNNLKTQKEIENYEPKFVE